MTDSVTIRMARADDRDSVLAFIERMGFAPRDRATWDALKMMAVTAWCDGRLIGAIPLEPRPFQLTSYASVPLLQQTMVAVEPAYRGRGIGSRMQETLMAKPPVGGALAGAYLDPAESAAAGWYRRNGFDAVMHVQKWCRDTVCDGCERVRVEDPLAEMFDWGPAGQVWDGAIASHSGGFVDRRIRRRPDWLRVHPRRHALRFHLVRRPGEGLLTGYALLGCSQSPTDAPVLEVLEIAATSSDVLEQVVRDVLTCAATSACKTVRWMLATTDPACDVARKCGFLPKGGFDMLIRPLTTFRPDGLRPAQVARWRFMGLDHV